MAKRLVFLFLSVALLVSLSGCLDQKKNIAERMLCLELTSQSFATIPDCTTQQECFEKVTSAFFGFDDSVFSYAERQKLFEHRNQLALSWLYYNRALKNIKRAHEICAANSDYFGLPQQINELNFNLSKAFEAVDSANGNAFALMLLQQSELQRQEVSLIKEEAVFDDFVLLSSNLNELQEKAAQKDAKTFAGKYLALVSEFGALSQKFGFSPTIMDESGILDFLGPAAPLVLKQFAGNSIFVPFVSSAVKGMINSVVNSFKLSGSVEMLKGFPSFEFSLLFGRMAGAQDSLAMEFGQMQKAIALHRAELKARNNENAQKISALIVSSGARIAEIDAESYSGFDQNLLADLYSLLGQEQTQISAQRFSLSQVSSLRSDAEFRLEELEKQFSGLKRKDFFSEISLGSKTSELKQLLLSIGELNSGLDFFTEEAITGLESLCESRIALIKKQLETGSVQQGAQLLGLKAKAEYYLQQFNEAAQKEKRLFYCRQAIESANSYSAALENFENFELGLKANAKDCLLFLANIFKTDSSKLSGFLQRYKQLENLLKNMAGIDSIQGSCAVLKEDVVLALSRDETVQSTGNNFARANEIISSLDSLKQHYPEALGGIAVDSLKRKSASLAEFFGPEGLAFDRSLSVLPELEQSASQLLQDALSEAREALIGFFRLSMQVKAFPVETAFLEKPVHARIRISFSSPFGFDFPLPLGFSVEFRSQNAALANSSGNVLSARLDSNRLFIDLNSVPNGLTFLELDSNFVVSAKKSEKIVFLDAGRATIRRSLEFSTPFEVERLFIELPLENSGAFDGFVLFNEKELPVVFSGQEAVFSLEKITDGAPAEFFYSLREPLGVSLQLLASRQLDQNTSQFEYSVSVQNNLPLKVGNPRILLPLPESANVSDARLFDSSGAQKILRRENGKASFSLEELLPKQSMQFSMLLAVKDSSQYWADFLQQARGKIFSLSLSDSKGVREGAAQLLGRIDSLAQSFDASDLGKLNELLSLSGEAERLSSEAAALEGSFGEFLRQKDSVETLLGEKRRELAVLLDLNLSGAAGELSADIAAAQMLLEEAVSAGALDDFNYAIEKLVKARGEFSKQQASGLNGLLLSQRDSLLSSQYFSAAQDSNSIGLKNDILLLDSLFLKSISSNDSNSSLSLLKQMQKKSADLNAAASANISKEALGAKKSIDSFLLLLSKKGVAAKLSRLQEIFLTVSDFDLEQANYVVPVSRQFLEKTKLKLSDFDSVSLQKRFAEFSAFFEKKDFFSAMKVAAVFKEDLNVKSRELQQIDDDLSKALARLEEDAKISVLALKGLAGQQKGTAILQQLKLAEKELDKGNFLKAIVIAKTARDDFSAATGFSALAKPDIPLAIYPLVAVIAVALFVRWYRNGKNQQPKRLQKLLRNP